MQIICTYQKTLYRDEYSGFTIFSAVPQGAAVSVSAYGTITLKGNIPSVPVGTPLKLECEMETDQQGREAYQITDFDYYVDGQQAMTGFLSALKLRGLGEATIQKISAMTTDLFAFVYEEDVKEKLQTTGLSEEHALQVIQTIRNLSEVKEIFSSLFQYGINYEQAVRLHKIFKNQTVTKIADNPYLMTAAEIPYCTCEKIAMQNGFTLHNPIRLESLLKSAMKRQMALGNTKVPFDILCQQCRTLEEEAGTQTHTSVFFLAGFLESAGLLLRHEDGDWFVYTQASYKKELEIARDVRRISLKSAVTPVSEKLIREVETECKITYSDAQKAAFQLIESAGIKILTGGPGTGKTTVVNGLITAFQKLHPEKVVTLCAPTGCAAKQLKKATGRKTSTMHKLLGIKAFGNHFVQSKNENNRFAADFIIVDESSMVDVDLMSMFLKAVKNNAILLLVGDEDQLPPVGGGNILHDLLETSNIPKCRLTQVYRQKNGSLIVENSAYIRYGMTESIHSGADYEIFHFDSEEDLKDETMRLMKKYWNRKSPSSVRIFSPVRNARYPLSTTILNNAMHDYYEGKKDAVIYRNKKFSKGDPVLFTINNYSMGYYNGDIGIISAIVTEGTKKSIVIDTEDGEQYTLSATNFGDIDLAYAMTTHKAQGSECDTAIVVLPERPGNMLMRSLLYVATTRAKKKNILLIQNGAMEKAIANTSSNFRYTGLKNRFTELFSAI